MDAEVHVQLQSRSDKEITLIDARAIVRAGKADPLDIPLKIGGGQPKDITFVVRNITAANRTAVIVVFDYTLPDDRETFRLAMFKRLLCALWQ